MTFYSGLAGTADRLLKKYGAPATLTRSVPGAYDPATGTTAAPTVTAYTGTGAKFDYAQRDIDGTLIKQGDQRVYLAVVGIVQPQTGDRLTIAGVAFTVAASRPLQPALTAVLHDVQVRGVR